MELAAGIVAAVKARGLDGIAVTEHDDLDFGYKLKRAVEVHFPGQVIIIPGWEVSVSELWFAEVVELDLGLPGGAMFRFLAHPSHPYPDQSTQSKYKLHGIELRNNLHDRQLNHARIRQAAQACDLLLLENSDAHSLGDIGSFFNEVDLVELATRAGASR